METKFIGLKSNSLEHILLALFFSAPPPSLFSTSIMSSYETVYLSGIHYGLREAIKDKYISQEARAEQSRLSNDREQLRAELFRTKKELELQKSQSQDQLRSVTRQWTEETTHLKEQIVKQSVSANMYLS